MKQKDIILVFVIIGVLVLFICNNKLGLKYISIVNVYNEKEPSSSEECFLINGKCVPVGQTISKGEVVYGYCSKDMVCVIEDKCEKTGGVYTYKFVVLGNRTFFEKKCLCPYPMFYSIKEGCHYEYK